MSDNRPWVWLIGGSQMSEPMADHIKRRGYRLLLSDADPNARCRMYAEHFLQVSVYDVSAHYIKAALISSDGLPTEHGLVTKKNMQAVLCIGCDSGPTVSAVSEGLGEFYIWPSFAAAVNTKNKALMRNQMGLHFPLWHAVSNINGRIFVQEYDHWVRKAKAAGVPELPLVVKPVDDRGSRGLQVWHGDEADMPVRDGDYLIEQYLEGVDVLPDGVLAPFDTSEAAFDYLVEEGKVYWLNGALRMFWRDRPGIEAGHVNPYFAPTQVNELAQLAAERLQIQRGILKLDVKQTPQGWALLELATRPSGGYDHMYTSDMALEGTSVRRCTEAIFDLALGNRVHPTDKFRAASIVAAGHKVAVCLAPIHKPGKIESWSIPNPDGCRVFTTTMQVRELRANQDRPVFVLGAADTLAEAYEKVDTLARQVQPVYEKEQQHGLT